MLKQRNIDTLLKNKLGRFIFFSFVLVMFFSLCSCQKNDTGMKDGYYYAETSDFDAHGWKEYVTIYVANDTIITVDYNAKNASGFIKSWDMEYMTIMNATDGIYPNKYTREYVEALLTLQDPYEVDAITGATHSYNSFQALAIKAIEHAYAGDESVAYVDLATLEH